MFKLNDPALKPIGEKVLADEPLNQADGEILYASRDIHGIGRMADHMRRKRHDDRTYYNRNRHINYTNVCALSCKFCSFYRKRGEEGAYEMPVEQVAHIAKKAADLGATEIHITGGLHPWKKLDYYTDMLKGIKAASPSLHVKAFTAIEILHFSRIARMKIAEVLKALRDAGLGSLPGGGAENFDERVHTAAFKEKAGAKQWFEVHRTAHAMGIPSNATMLYGHVDLPADRVSHLIQLREAQAEALKLRDEAMEARVAGDTTDDTPLPAAFNCVIPLSFVPDKSEFGYLPGPTGLTDLKTLAISRLILNNIPHIKAFWIMQGIGLSQIALNYGCDDLDGTVVWYDITKRQGADQHQHFHVNDIQRLIREARHRPVERDTLYHEVKRDAEDRVVQEYAVALG